MLNNVLRENFHGIFEMTCDQIIINILRYDLPPSFPKFAQTLIFFTHCSAKPRIKVGTMEVVSRAFKFELCFHYRILLAGFPNMVDSGATSLKIAAPAATVLYIPTRTLSLTTEFGAICTPSSMCA